MTGNRVTEAELIELERVEALAKAAQETPYSEKDYVTPNIRRFNNEANPAFVLSLIAYVRELEKRVEDELSDNVRLHHDNLDLKDRLTTLQSALAEKTALSADLSDRLDNTVRRLNEARAQLAQRDARIVELERTCVKAVVPLEALHLSATRLTGEIRIAISEGILAVRAALASAPKAETDGWMPIESARCASEVKE